MQTYIIAHVCETWITIKIMLYIYISNPSRSLQQGLPAKSEARWDLLGHKLDLLLLLDTCRPDAPLVSGVKRVKPLRNHGQGVSCVPFEENPTIGKVTNNIQQHSWIWVMYGDVKNAHWVDHRGIFTNSGGARFQVFQEKTCMPLQHWPPSDKGVKDMGNKDESVPLYAPKHNRNRHLKISKMYSKVQISGTKTITDLWIKVPNTGAFQHFSALKVHDILPFHLSAKPMKFVAFRREANETASCITSTGLVRVLPID